MFPERVWQTVETRRCPRGRGAMCSEGEARRRNEKCSRGRGAMLNVRAREVLCIARAYQIIDVGCPVF